MTDLFSEEPKRCESCNRPLLVDESHLCVPCSRPGGRKNVEKYTIRDVRGSRRLVETRIDPRRIA